MRQMFDSITPSAIPANAGMVACYVDGAYANESAARSRFPKAICVPIAVFASTNNGIVLDVETGDATSAQAPGWVAMRRRAGVNPSVYCNRSTWPAVIQSFLATGVPMPAGWWVAQYDDVPTLPTVTVAGVTYTAVAKQYADPPTSGGNYDVSAVADYWPGVDPGGDMLVTDPITYTSHVDGTTRSTTVGAALAAAADLHEQYTKGYGGVGPAGPMGTALLAVQAAVGTVDADVRKVDSDLSVAQATLLAAIKAVPAGDVPALAAALAPALAQLLPADATPQQVGDAVVAALAAHLA